MSSDREATFRVESEDASVIKEGAILDVTIRVRLCISKDDLHNQYTYFSVNFRRSNPDEDFEWYKTEDDEDDCLMMNDHVHATRLAARYIEDHYVMGVDLRKLE